MLSWVNFGDLHVSDEDHWQSLDCFSRLIYDSKRKLATSADFAYLPGDIANHAAPKQYRRLGNALDQLKLRWFGIPGDHDFEQGSLDNFYGGLGTGALHSVGARLGHGLSSQLGPNKSGKKW